MNTRQTGPEHEALMNALNEVMLANRDMPLDEMLAVASNWLGRLIAAQDQTKYTPERVMQFVSNNIMFGNKAAIDHIMGGTPMGNA
jgi:hypothetical protein